MAILVCYTTDTLGHQDQNKAIYLDQDFYQMIVTLCLQEKSDFRVLAEIARLKYKSPTFLIAGKSILQLFDELAHLVVSGGSHSQIDGFKAVCDTALKCGSSLALSGDMYPELT